MIVIVVIIKSTSLDLNVIHISDEADAWPAISLHGVEIFEAV